MDYAATSKPLEKSIADLQLAPDATPPSEDIEPTSSPPDNGGTRTASPSSQLCAKCSAFDFKEAFYPLKTSISPKLLPGEPSPESMTFEWSTLLQNHEVCAFCRILLASMRQTKTFNNIEAPAGHLDKVQLKLDGIGTVIWTPSPQAFNNSPEEVNSLAAPGWRRVDDSFHRTVRRLVVRGCKNQQFVETHVLPAGADAADRLNVRDALLHYRDCDIEQVDLKLAKTWLQVCQWSHDRCCEPGLLSNMGKARLRMIDVKRRCVVSVDRQVPYFALSYCWGDPDRTRKGVLLTQATQKRLCRDGALADDREDLPNTIRDAILVTKEFGCPYLWVDALCILQDDERSKMAQIDQMGQIYAHAALTIVAASGKTAWSGLPGLRTNSRTYQSVKEQVGGVNLATRWPRQDYAAAITRGPWVRRAWTLQEHILSSRRIIFTAHELLFECEHGVWSEGLHVSDANLYPDTVLHIRSKWKHTVKPSASLSPLQRYNFLMQAASSRALGYQEDRLNCIQGLLNTFRKDLSNGFFWGMPLAVLDSSLLFHTGPLTYSYPGLRRDGFPSWCWAGWTRPMQSSIAGPYAPGFSGNKRDDEILYVQDWCRDASWIRKEVAFSCMYGNYKWYPLNTYLISDEGSVFYKESLMRWKDSDPEETISEVNTRIVRARVPSSHVLAFWTQNRLFTRG